MSITAGINDINVKESEERLLKIRIFYNDLKSMIAKTKPGMQVAFRLSDFENDQMFSLRICREVREGRNESFREGERTT